MFKALRYFAALLILGGAVVYLLGGKNPIHQVQLAIYQVQEQSRAEALGRLKEQYWAQAYQPSRQCQSPMTELMRMECNNRADNARQAFEINWNRQIAAGWNPSRN